MPKIFSLLVILQLKKNQKIKREVNISKFAGPCFLSWDTNVGALLWFQIPRELSIENALQLFKVASQLPFSCSNELRNFRAVVISLFLSPEIIFFSFLKFIEQICFSQSFWSKFVLNQYPSCSLPSVPVTSATAASDASFESFNSCLTAWKHFWLMATVKLTQTRGYYCQIAVCAKGGCEDAAIGDPLIKGQIAFGWGKGWCR